MMGSIFVDNCGGIFTEVTEVSSFFVLMDAAAIAGSSGDPLESELDEKMLLHREFVAAPDQLESELPESKVKGKSNSRTST